MKWLIIQSDGLHRGQDGWCPNWQFRECYAIQHALQENGHTAEIWGLRHTNYGAPVDFESYDALFVAENYEMEWLPDFSKIRRPLKVQWIIDAHYQEHSVYDPIATGCDIILQSTRCYVNGYKYLHPAKTHLWFPNGVDDRYFNHDLYSPIERTSDLVFIGGNSRLRQRAIEEMCAKAGMDYRYGVTGLDYVNALRAAKIQWNKGVNGDINYRNFETIGLECCLLTEYHPDLEALGFKPGENCFFYRTMDEAVQIAKSALISGLWVEVAGEGFLFSKTQTYAKRISQLLGQILGHG